MLGGWIGNVLRINLSKMTYNFEPLNYEWAKLYLGGRGLASKYFIEEVDPTVDPFSQDNKLILSPGPLTGTYGAANGRYMMITKSPLTGTIASSNSGGYFPAELKYAGIDLVIIEGKASHPVYITIYNNQVAIKDASKIWGKTSDEVENYLHSTFHRDAKIASIGPAGEKQVLFAAIMNDKHRAAGRSGVGAVMGSKNLKAIAVRGTLGVKVADRVKFREAATDAFRAIKESPVTAGGLPAYGTAVLVNIINQNGLLPTRNFQDDVFEDAENISGKALAKQLLVRNKACMSCMIGCARVTKLADPRYKAQIGEGPEYETIFALGSDCGVSDLNAITKANYLCNEYGMDPISAGATVACAMEMFEKGIIPQSDIGMPLKFGDADALVKMIELTGKREGFGDKLALGSYRLASLYGHPEFSMSVKKQEFPAYDGRVAQGMALEYATSNRGACHVRGYMISPEIMGVPEKLDPYATENKAFWTKTFQDVTAVVDSVGMCLFTTFAININHITNLFTSATGLDYTQDDMMKAGERIYNIERLFNLKAGIDPSQDTLPKRILEEPVKQGPAKGMVAKLSELLPEYYKERGWGSDGIPTQEKLKELNIA